MKEPKILECMAKCSRILCIGDLCADLVVPYGRVKQFADGNILYSPENSNVVFRQGGSVANTAAVLGKMKETPVFITSVGNDEAGRFLREEMENHGVDMGYSRVSQKGSMICIAVLDECGERTMFHWVPPWGDYPRFSDLDFPKNLSEIPSILFTSGMVLNQDFESAESILRFLDRMKSGNDSFFVFDLNTRTETYGMDQRRRSLYHEFVRRADIVIGSGLEEFQPVFEKDHLEECVKKMVQDGKIVIEHSGAEPVHVFCFGEVHEVPICRVKPVSTVGAGDAFNGAFIHGIRQKKDLLECVRYANSISAYVISHEGHFILPE